MIHVVTTYTHRYTVRHLARSLSPHIARWTYEGLLRRRSIPAGVWIFTDHERLSSHELSLAGEIADTIRSAGGEVLNHPSLVRGRYDLQKTLRQIAINDFEVYRADEHPRPRAFPVFIRSESDHRGSIGGLLESQEALERTMSDLCRAGEALAGKLVIEYAGEEVEPGIWHRYATYRVGDEIIPHHKALGSAWMVKDGFDAERLSAYAGRDSFVASERRFVIEGEHIDVLRRAFEAAGIEYGRADFAIVRGRPQIYEINTNPYHARAARLWRTIHPDREATQRFSEGRLREAIVSLDRPLSGRIPLTSARLRPHQSILPLLRRPTRRP